MRVLTLNVALIAIVAACAEDNGQGTQSVDAATLTYHADIAPIIQAECTSCHSPDNIGPFDLTSLANVQQYSAAIEQSIRSGSMPPIPAKDTNCQELDDERIMNTADKRKVLDWIDGKKIKFYAPTVYLQADDPHPAPTLTPHWPHPDPPLTPP